MNGYKYLTESAALLGIEGCGDTIKIIGLPLINVVLSEIGLLELSSLSEDVGLVSSADKAALLFGLAVRIASAMGDDEASAEMEKIYKRKLSTLKGRTLKVKDKLPKGDWI